jgi:hypothetical protein
MKRFVVEFESYTTYRTTIEADSIQEARDAIESNYCEEISSAEITGGNVVVTEVFEQNSVV